VAQNNERTSLEVGGCRKNMKNVFSDNFLYVFVDIEPGNEKSDFYVVPSKIAVKYIKQSHASYLRALCLVL
jgi:hypothetical protein